MTLVQMIKKLQLALNVKGEHILLTTSQFYSVEQNRPVTCFHVKKAIIDEESGKSRKDSIELFSTYSRIQVLFFLRDYLYELEGREVPTDNPLWNEAKDKYYKRLNKGGDE